MLGSRRSIRLGRLAAWHFTLVVLPADSEIGQSFNQAKAGIMAANLLDMLEREIDLIQDARQECQRDLQPWALGRLRD